MSCHSGLIKVDLLHTPPHTSTLCAVQMKGTSCTPDGVSFRTPATISLPNGKTAQIPAPGGNEGTPASALNAHKFKCNCTSSKAKGGSSCLNQFNTFDYRAFETSLYGSHHDRSESPGQVRKRLHSLMWDLREPNKLKDGSADKSGRFHIKTWKLTNANGVSCEVCRDAFKHCLPASLHAHRYMYALVSRGHSPAHLQAGTASKKTEQLLDTLEHVVHSNSASRIDYATSFWVDLMRCCDYMPNDNRLVLRGPGYGFYHREIYGPRAKKNEVYFAYKSWRNQIGPALRIVAKELPMCDPNTLSFGRSERHSKFPECVQCQTRREAYLAAVRNPLSSPEVVKEKLDSVLEHQGEWTGDRQGALELRRAHFLNSTDTMYECDDKCGSWWQTLPVVSGGRYNKASVKNVYHFSIQCNSVCGTGGVVRFAFVPKNISTGSNFGLTNLLMAIWRAKEKGTLGSKRKLIRHTDGGPDNLSYTSHILHWLLVYIGVFDEVLWFRFESGHSHTEIADRLFALLKKIFDTDSNVRVAKPVQSFAELESILQDKFSALPEEVLCEFNMANWDFKGWFQNMAPDLEEGNNMFEGDFARFTFDNVFSYMYVGAALASHGGVKMTYKERLSTRGDSREAEWLPIERQKDLKGNEINATTNSGVTFIDHPPDLRSNPLIEPFHEEKEDKPADSARRVLKTFKDSLDPEATADWQALQQLHSSAPHAGAVPLMPHTVETNIGGASMHSKSTRVFCGTPMELKPILKALCHLERRPLITWDIFSEPAPTSFPTSAGDVQQPKEVGQTDDGVKPLRTPAVVNTVTHKGYTAGERAKDTAGLDAEQWLEAQPNRLDDDHWDDRDKGGGLYIVLLDKEDADGELLLGLGRDCGPTPGQAQYRKLQWFARCSKVHVWAASSKFKDFKQSNNLEFNSFLIQVNENDGDDGELADVTPSHQRDAPYLNSGFVSRLKKFAFKHNHMAGSPAEKCKGKAAQAVNKGKSMDNEGLQRKGRASVDSNGAELQEQVAKKATPSGSQKVPRKVGEPRGQSSPQAKKRRVASASTHSHLDSTQDRQANSGGGQSKPTTSRGRKHTHQAPPSTPPLEQKRSRRSRSKTC